MLLVLRNYTLIALQLILVYISKVDGKFLFSPASVNFLTEFMKVVFAIGMILWQVSKQQPGERSLLSPNVFLMNAKLAEAMEVLRMAEAVPSAPTGQLGNLSINDPTSSMILCTKLLENCRFYFCRIALPLEL